MNRSIAINPEACIGCKTCETACASIHKRVGMQTASRVTVVETRSVSAAVMCHHCENAPCLEVCPVGVIRQIEHAICIDEQRCIGCKMCAIACPYGAIRPSGTSIAGVAGVCYKTPTFSRSISPLLKWEIGVAAVAVKCDLCQGLSDKPQCIEACPTQALLCIDKDSLDEVRRSRGICSAERVSAVLVDRLERGRTQ